MSRGDPNDPERALRPRTEDWSGTLFDHPVAPAAPKGEQRELAIRPSPEAILAAWRATPEGAEVYRWIAGEAVGIVARGGTRLSAKHLLEQARAKYHRCADNRVTPALVRCLEDEYPLLRSRFEKRKRAAA